MTHPAFSNIHDSEIRTALSEPFVTVDAHVVFNNFGRKPAERVTPLAVGVLALHEGQPMFMAGISCQSTTPLNHASQYLEEYGYHVGRAHDPIFEDKPDGRSTFELVNALQGNIRRVVAEEDLRVVAGFMLGITNDPKMTIAGFVVARKAFASLKWGLVEGFNKAEGVFDTASTNEEAAAEDKPTKESLIDTVRELTIPTSVGRLLPGPSVVKGALMQYPAIRNFYGKTKKAQRKALIAERHSSAIFN